MSSGNEGAVCPHPVTRAVPVPATYVQCWLTCIAAGKASVSPPPPDQKAGQAETESKPKTQLPPRIQSSAKRKLVGKETEPSDTAPKDGGGKKKKKGDKKLLSFEQED